MCVVFRKDDYKPVSLSSHRIVEELASGELGQVDQGGHVRVARAEQEQVHADLKLAKLHRFILQRRPHSGGSRIRVIFFRVCGGFEIDNSWITLPGA